MILLIIIILIATLAVGYWLFMSSYSQVFGEYTWHGDRSRKQIALTFDDGPNKPYTQQILKILEKNNIKATFFMVGSCVERDPDTAIKVRENGHVIGNHSYSHKFSNYLVSLKMDDEIKKCQDTIKKHLGVVPALYRPPWLFRHPIMLKNLKDNKLFPVSGQFCHSFEVAHINGKKIADHVIKIARNGSIIIFHDGKEAEGGVRPETVKALPLIIAELKKQGFSFVTVPELLDIEAYN